MEEENTSYSIYINRRPLRTLYIFSKKQITFEHLDQIIEYNQGKWGGRYNFILPVSNKTIVDTQWQFLKRYDPDFVQLYTPITKSLALNLDTRITPLQVTGKSLNDHLFLGAENSGISILPTNRNIHQISNPLSGDPPFVLFNVDNCQDATIKSFITRNFGTLDLREISNLSLNQYPNKIILEITDKQSFIKAITSFNDFKPYIFPIQLCSIGDFIDDDRSIDNENNFYIFIGESPLDLLDFWNNPFYLMSWTRSQLRQLWIPKSMIEDPDLIEPIKKLIHGRADPYGNGQKNVIFSSRTISQKQLDSIATELTTGIWVSKKTLTKKKEFYPSYSDWFSFDNIKTDMLHVRGSGKKEKIIVPAPDVERGIMGGEYWMNDLYVQVPERKVIPVNFETWLQLPRNNSVAHTTIEGLARITNNGVPCVLTSRSSQFQPQSQEFTFKFPTTWDTFASIIMNAGKPCFTNDARKKYIKPYEYTINVSEAGRHIHGFIEVFGNLENAYHILEGSHWRKFFDLMANVSEEKENQRLDEIKNRLQKKITSYKSNPTVFTSNEFVEWLASDLQKTAKMYVAANPKSVSFSSLEKIAKDNISEFNTRNPSNKYRYSRKQLVDALSGLTNSGVVLIGYEVVCPSCLNREWRSLGDIEQTIICRGCGYQYNFKPEKEVRYKLNTITENAIRIKGVVPVVLALGTLFSDARHYFDFLPPVDIHKKKHLTDLDICCTVDGEFVIGEVKKSHKLFHPDDFDTMVKIAKDIRPNRLIFSSLDEKIPQTKKDIVEKLNKELSDYGIKVEWLNLDTFVFEISPFFY
jgi:hypothetical protein